MADEIENLERNEVWWRCTDCEVDVSYKNLIKGVRCPYCGGARTIPRTTPKAGHGEGA